MSVLLATTIWCDKGSLSRIPGGETSTPPLNQLPRTATPFCHPSRPPLPCLPSLPPPFSFSTSVSQASLFASLSNTPWLTLPRTLSNYICTLRITTLMKCWLTCLHLSYAPFGDLSLSLSLSLCLSLSLSVCQPLSPPPLPLPHSERPGQDVAHICKLKRKKESRQ